MPRTEILSGVNIAIVGGGMTGLAAAWELAHCGQPVRVALFESDRWGGIIRTRRDDGYLWEGAADSFLATPELPDARRLVEELGLQDELLPTARSNRRALILRNATRYPVPEGFYLMAPSDLRSVARTRILSLAGRVRLATERWIPPRHDDADESLAAFATRRLGREAYRWLAQPLAAGIYAGDPCRLSMQAAFPQFVQWERRYGSLAAAMQARTADGVATASGARYDKFLTLRGGIQQLTDTLVQQLPHEWLRPQTAVRNVLCKDDGWWLHLDKQPERFDRVIVATPPASPPNS